mmetsp:Transcript_154286/g.493530  ORF Transcript_154286/g.493530 Transcript_154286/m.493530 type:complete len:235 (-) Transcript_154286:605-1309(-)
MMVGLNLSISFSLASTLELGVRLFVSPRDVLTFKLDALIVVSGWLEFALSTAGTHTWMPDLQIMRFFRIFEILRRAKWIVQIPALSRLLIGFVGAMEAMVYGVVLIMVLLLVWGVFAVEFVQPVSLLLPHEEGDWCAEALSSVQAATLLLFQSLVAGDAWGTCAVPLILKRPELFFFFAFAFTSVQLGCTNLVLSVIVDKAAKARDDHKELEKHEKNKNSGSQFPPVVCGHARG